jgi:hypothetical protein
MPDLHDEGTSAEPARQERAETEIYWGIVAYCILVLLCLIVIASARWRRSLCCLEKLKASESG